MAFKSAMLKGSPVLLEPVMSVNVYTPDEHIGDVIGDINSRRGRILDSKTEFNQQVISAEVPLGKMFGYSTQLRSMTKGRASYDMEFKYYGEVPKSEQEAIVKDNKKE
jgi:elongation factor G